MSAQNKPLVTAADNKIAPQYYNPTSDQYEHVQGKNGGNNVNVIESALPAGAATAAKQDQQTGHLEALVAKDFATDAKLDLILSKLGDIESEIEAIKSTDGIKRIDEAVDVQLTGSNAQVDGSTTPPIQNMLFSGTNWDRWRNNTEGTLLASASRSATTTSPKQTNYNARGVNIYLNITAIPNDAAQKLIVFVREFDPVSGRNRVLTSFEIAGNVSPRVHLFKIYPGIVETSDIEELYTKGLNLGRTWDIQIWHTGSGAWTYSVGYSYTL